MRAWGWGGSRSVLKGRVMQSRHGARAGGGEWEGRGARTLRAGPRNTASLRNTARDTKSSVCSTSAHAFAGRHTSRQSRKALGPTAPSLSALDSAVKQLCCCRRPFAAELKIWVSGDAMGRGEGAGVREVNGSQIQWQLMSLCRYAVKSPLPGGPQREER